MAWFVPRTGILWNRRDPNGNKGSPFCHSFLFCPPLLSLVTPAPAATTPRSCIEFPRRQSHRSTPAPPALDSIRPSSPSVSADSGFEDCGDREMGSYIGQHGVATLRRYKYSGVDHSLVAKYILQPFWSRFVHIFPLWFP